MKGKITRRDFLDGMALTITAGLAPRDLLARGLLAAPYPPALTGLRGQHDGSFEAAHTMPFDRARYLVDHLPVEEEYDCIVVGGWHQRTVRRMVLQAAIWRGREDPRAGQPR